MLSGLESAVAERGSLITHQRLCDHRGRLLADIDLAALWGDVGPCLALHRADLHEVLASHGDPVPPGWAYRCSGSASKTTP